MAFARADATPRPVVGSSQRAPGAIEDAAQTVMEWTSHRSRVSVGFSFSIRMSRGGSTQRRPSRTIPPAVATKPRAGGGLDQQPPENLAGLRLATVHLRAPQQLKLAPSPPINMAGRIPIGKAFLMTTAVTVLGYSVMACKFPLSAFPSPSGPPPGSVGRCRMQPPPHQLARPCMALQQVVDC